MKKSVYSILLFDDIVKAVDQAAYAEGTSRSGMINRILAGYVSCTTPEMQMKCIFDELSRLIGTCEVLQIRQQPSEAMISIRSLLQYKYNPTIRYSVELYRDTNPAVGMIRVASRTKSVPLVSALNGFFDQFTGIEQTLLLKYAPGYRVTYAVDEGRFSREFVLTGELLLSGELAGQAIAEYIKMLDTALKGYFSSIEDPSASIAAVMQTYSDYLKKTRVLI